VIKTPTLAALCAIAAFVAASTLVGISVPGFYEGSSCAASREAFLGQDMVSLIVLFVFVPAFLAARRSSLPGAMISLGCLSYYSYTYGYYSFGLADTPLYLAYLAIFGASVYAFIFIALSFAPSKVLAESGSRIPRVAVSVFLIFAAAFTGIAIELPPLLKSAFAGEAAGMRSASAFMILDLAILFPGMVIAACLALRRRSEGYFFSGVLLVKTVTLMPAIVAADLVNLAERGELIDPSFDIVATAFFASSLVLSIIYFRSLPKAAADKGAALSS